MAQTTRHLETRWFSVKLTYTNLWPQPFGFEVKVQVFPPATGRLTRRRGAS